ncbi:MAG: response regulator [Bacteroidia bacterium]|nr:response regulator [Bacteroidia bacterium]
MGKKKHQILVVDDDPNIRMLLEFLLRKKYSITTRPDGLNGLAWISAGNLPDLIILDIDMPIINGFEFLSRIRESGLYRDIPVVMLSGYEEDEVKEKCLSKGQCAYLLKPFNPEEVFSTIEQLLTVEMAA